MKNLIIALILTPIVAPLMGLVFALLALGFLIGGVVVMISTPLTLLKHLNQQDDDRRKLTGEQK